MNLSATAALPSNSANPKCYAAQLNDCKGSVNREHFISKAVLERLSPKDGMLSVTGMKASAGGTRKISIASMTAKILCQRHNGMLSKIDEGMVQFFDAVTSGSPPAKSFVLNNSHRVRSFSGRMIERWFLKAAIGILASSSVSLPGMLGNWVPEGKLVEVLFRNIDFSKPFGLYAAAHKKIEGDLGFRIHNQGNSLLRLECSLANVGFSLIVSGDVSLPAENVYRPPEFFRDESPPGHVFLVWNETGSRERVTIRYR